MLKNAVNVSRQTMRYIDKRNLQIRSIFKRIVPVLYLAEPFSSSKSYISCQNSRQEVLLTESEENKFCKDVLKNVNDQILKKTHGRLFATVYISGSQHIISANDLIAVKMYFPPNIGDKIKFDKVLCVGASDFTLYGRPLLPKEFVKIEATVVEKSLLATRVLYKPRGSTNFVRDPYTVLRINSISLDYPVDEPPSITGVEGKIF